MGLVIAPVLWVVRRGPETWDYGDPYTDMAVVLRDGTTAILEAWSGDGPTAKEWRHLAAELRRYGFTHVRYDRRKDGRVRTAYRRL